MMRKLLLLLTTLAVGCGGSTSTAQSPPGLNARLEPAAMRRTANPVLAASPEATFTVNLQPGWNGVTLQVDYLTQIQTPPEVIGFVAFENGHYLPPEQLTTTSLNEGEGTSQGFLVYATRATSFTYGGTPRTGAEMAWLTAGWNLICPPATTVAGLTAERNEVTVPPPTQFFEVRPDLTYQLAISALDPSRPYWVNVPADTLLEGGLRPVGQSDLPDASPLASPEVLVEIPPTGIVDYEVTAEGSPRVDDATRYAVFKDGVLWPKGSDINVLFVDGDNVPAEVYARVETIVETYWGPYVNLRFHWFTGPPERDDREYHIRVRFLTDSGYNSFLGTTSRGRKPASMNLSRMHKLPANSTQFAGTVLHEFGHALGMEHEHQNPSVNIPWDKEGAYESLGSPPNNWTRARTDFNVFRTVTSNLHSDFDPQSIMMYAISADWTLNRQAYQRGNRPSVTDQEWMLRAYPP